MIVEYIRYVIEPARADAFEQAYRDAAGPLGESPHCVDYELTRCVEEPQRYVLRIRWDSLDGHLEGFRSSDEFRRFVTHIRPYVPMIEEMQHYETTDVMGSGSATPS